MNPILLKIKTFNAPLLPDLVAIKYKLMQKDIYSFFRGTNHLFYEEVKKDAKLPFSPSAWICGDLHMQNFGSYKGDNRLVYFDLNDFDEAALAPASWEILRFLTSIFIAFYAQGMAEKKAENMARLYLKVYSQTLAGGKAFYVEPQTAKGIVSSFLNTASSHKQKDLLLKRTVKTGGKRRLRINHKYLELGEDVKKALIDHFNNWIVHNNGRPYNYEVRDVVFRVAGLGSLGLKRYLFLLKSTNLKEKYILVDMKEARRSSVKPAGVSQPGWEDEAERVMIIQTRMQNIAPFLLSKTVWDGKSYLVQELQPIKDSIQLEFIKDRYRDIYQVISDMALLSASAQLRAAGRQNSASADDLVLFGQNCSWQESMILRASHYAQLTKQQYKAFRQHTGIDNKATNTSRT